jgi:hypothetical protein
MKQVLVPHWLPDTVTVAADAAAASPAGARPTVAASSSKGTSLGQVMMTSSVCRASPSIVRDEAPACSHERDRFSYSGGP